MPAVPLRCSVLLAAQSLIPVIVMIAVGALLRLMRFLDEDEWIGFEKVSYHVFFPALVTETLARADLSGVPILGTAGALVTSILVVAACLMLCRPMLERAGVDGPAFTSIFQGSTRWNTFVALALATSLGGARGVTMSALCIALMIPLLNFLAVSVLTRYAAGKPQSLRGFVRTLLANPFVWSSAIGLALNLSGDPVPAPVMDGVMLLGKAALPCGLLLVGAGLEMTHLRRPGIALGVAVVIRLFLMPLLASTLAKASGLAGVDLLVVVIATAVPTANATYVLARRMGGDAPLMAAIVTVQTLLSVITLPLMIALLT